MPRAVLRPGGGRGVGRDGQAELAALLKFRDLLGQRGLLLRERVALGGQVAQALVGVPGLGGFGFERVEFALERLHFLLCSGEVFGGFRRHAFFKLDLLQLVVRSGFGAHHFGHEPRPLVGESFALLRQHGELPLGFALGARELRAHGLA